MFEQKLERLIQAGIELVPADIPTHYIVTRDGFLALIERRGDDFGAAGAAGLLTEQGLAPLVWRGESAWFVTRRSETKATPEQVEALRRFQADVEAALR